MRTKEQAKKYASDWRLRNPGRVKAMDRATSLRSLYGITVQQYDEMLRSQQGVCAICKGSCASGRNLAVDHDHNTGKIRGLLCGNCNQGIGRFSDDQEIMQAAINYINRHAASRPILTIA